MVESAANKRFLPPAFFPKNRSPARRFSVSLIKDSPAMPPSRPSTRTQQDTIAIRGARQNNLKNIDLDIPRDKLVVITGLSGSGKSSLAFDTLYAEGQRRYVESLSAYARQFLGQMQ